MTTNRHASDVESRRLGEPLGPVPAPISLQRRRHVAAFVEAAVGLAGPDRDGEDRRTLRREAGDALVGLAELGAVTALGEALRPDPAEAEVTFTIACYQIGDLVPCSLRDLRDPADAVRALAACPDERHVAAELLASTPAGLRWSALARTGGEVSYRSLDEATASGVADELLAGALERWAARVEEWSLADGEAPGAGLLGEAPAGEGQASDVEAVLFQLAAAVHALEDHLSSQDDLLGQLQGRLSAIEQRLARIEQRSGVAAARDLDATSW